jgi:hypothetical protein
MGKRRTETVYLSQLEDMQILWPGDVHALAEFVLRCYDARGRAGGPSQSTARMGSRLTVHALAGHLAWIAGIPEVRIERQFEEHGLSLDATLEFDPTPPPAAGPSSRSEREMGRRKHSVRGRVISAWEKCGKPNWDTQRTLAICIQVDGELEAENREPAPRFREAITLGNQKYLIHWVQGCHFRWLNPR